MEVFVGTSGWFYGWNKKRSLDWYIQNSGLNAVELNASFYRFPHPNNVKSWATKGKRLRWAIKVNRWITHTLKFSEKALGSWEKFEKLFTPLEPNIDFYLFQLPPFIKSSLAPKIENFIRKTGLEQMFALEVRNMTWFDKKWIDWASSLGISWVSVDCPDFPLDVVNTSGVVYERMHGRYGWYTHYYSDDELKEVATKILEAEPSRAYIFFNNNHAMLDNSRKMLSMLAEMATRYEDKSLPTQ
ncbi:MAG: DUF72 domain-containing protein [Candidatus Bathyarchaeia archaeon]